ncbi:HEAT repeat domain-containing protein [Myxococcota bacterium]|nr:HEAT repeat domain-containing protein [Myxococcota bacterium]
MILLLLGLGCSPAPEAVATGMGSENLVVREDMVAFAKQYDDELVVLDALHKALDDPSSRVRLRAAESLGELASPESVQFLLKALEDSDDRVRKEAVDALGRIGDPQAVGALMAYIESRRLDGEIPLNAIWALGNIADPTPLSLLMELRDNSDPYVAYNAMWALRQIGDKKGDGATTAEGEGAGGAEGAPAEGEGGGILPSLFGGGDEGEEGAEEAPAEGEKKPAEPPKLNIPWPPPPQ